MTLKRTLNTILIPGAILIAAACSAESPASDAGEPAVDKPDKGATAQIPDEPTNLDDWLRGNVFINETELLIMESYPIQVSLNVLGELPTPCDKLDFEVAPPDEENQIQVDIYSLYDPAGTCIQVIEPFETSISITTLETPLEDGLYTVWVNGELVGEFNYPGG